MAVTAQLTVTVQPRIYTVQAPVLNFDPWGNPVITYEPLELRATQVTFPTGPYVYVYPECEEVNS